ncbi:MAG: hypothetical protein LBG57_12080 [Treponema sp.]|jgi:hypothetical protein|nr:hypothetical protein [Treponema sp.]
MRHSTLQKPAFLFLFGALFALGSCNQDAIFHEISQSNKPLEARIKGGPTNMAVFKRNGKDYLCVASGDSLYSYAKSAGWDKGTRIPKPDGTITSLAATSAYLYASTTKGLKRIGNTEANWADISTDSALERVYAAGDKVFVGKKASGDKYAILYIDEQKTPLALPTLRSDTGLLTGAVFNGSNYYLCTSKTTEVSGQIYKVEPGASGFPGTVTSLNTEHYLGMVSLENNGTASDIAAIRQDGQLVLIDGSSGAINLKGKTSTATGALAVWRSSADSTGLPRLILAGRRDSSYVLGYQEQAITNGVPSGSFVKPATSMHHGGNYDSSIGEHAVNHLFQAPYAVDTDMTLFASTQKDGLWSYRNRSSGGWQWNAEE